MQNVIDPEFDERVPFTPGVCRSGRCSGDGWIQVGEAYVDQWAGPPPSIPEGETEFERLVFEEIHRTYRALRAAYAASSYPCPSCQPIQFDRWAGDHWGRYHDRAGCTDCRRVDAASGIRRSGSKRRREKEPEPTYSPPDEPEPEQLRADLA